MVDDSGSMLEFSLGQKRLRFEAWGDDSIRVRAGSRRHTECDKFRE
jgi:hypothetical protein